MIAAKTEPAGAPSWALGFAFDVIPSALLADHKDGNLTLRDLLVVSQMIQIGRWGGRNDSCWTTRAILAQRLGVSTKTIQASWRRLKARGWILEQLVGDADPLDARNRTRRRYWFGWLVDGRVVGTPGGTVTTPPPGRRSSPNKRGNPSPEETTDAVVVSAGPGTGDTNPAPSPMPDTRTAPIKPLAKPEAPPLPATLADALASPAIGEPLRRQLGRMLPRWLAAHPVERVAAALKAMIEASRQRRVRSPIGYLVNTLANMEAEGERSAELAPPPPPTRTPDADRTGARLAEIRRGEFEAGERERRWRALPDAARRAIEVEVEASSPRPPGMPERLWALTRRAACLERMDEFGLEDVMRLGSAKGGGAG